MEDDFRRSKLKGSGRTMHDVYKDGSDTLKDGKKHICCSKCGHCLYCDDCRCNVD